MTVRLAVAGAFHTDFMSPAVEKLRQALAQTPIMTPRIPVVSNVDAQPHSDPAVIRDILARQVLHWAFAHSNFDPMAPLGGHHFHIFWTKWTLRARSV